jgi:stage V sporulation protein R
MEYEQLSKSYAWGLSKIYEMVINTNPCYAYLLSSNPLVDQKLVMAHVYAHSDFFKNNCFFAHTSRKAMDDMANHGSRVRSYGERYGHEKVETFLDSCLSIDNLIDPHSTGIRRHDMEGADGLLEETDEEAIKVERIKSKEYMDAFVNPQEFLDAKKAELEVERRHKKDNFPSEPERDVLGFLVKHAPLEPWQRDILSIIRDEAYYFAPQWMTKIMNEGWASYWHSKMMTGRLCTDNEIIDFADHHSGTTAMPPGRINPYKIGLELFRDIEDRWDTGRHGTDYEKCDDYHTKQKWDTKAMQGRAKIFEVRRFHNDLTFIDTFLTREFCEKHQLFKFGKDKFSDQYVIQSREFDDIKKQFLQSLTNGGQPIIVVADANGYNQGELCLRHEYDGVELKKDYAQETLRNMYAIWKRPVNIETVLKGKSIVLSFDGKRFDDVTVLDDDDDDDNERNPTW